MMSKVVEEDDELDEIDELARELYKVGCDVMDEEVAWERGGYKTQVVYWQALARAAKRWEKEKITST